jgi:transcriptional regulator GlxA family with amidase domain
MDISEDTQAVAPAVDFAEAQLRAGRDVHVFAMAAHCRLEATAFTRRFRAAHGRPPGDWLGWRRTVMAVERLQHTEDSITEIALSYGFASSQHLAVCCRRHFGTTPTRLRSEAHGASGAERDARRDAGVPVQALSSAVRKTSVRVRSRS